MDASASSHLQERCLLRAVMMTTMVETETQALPYGQ